jgi:hypothetical protein
VLLLVQAAMALLAGVAMLLFMQGNPAMWPVAIGLPILLFIFAANARRDRRWARKSASAIQWLMLAGFTISALLSLLPALDFSVNLMTLLTNLVLPITLIKLLRHARRIEVERHVVVASTSRHGEPVLSPRCKRGVEGGEVGAQRPVGAPPAFESADAAI